MAKSRAPEVVTLSPTQLEELLAKLAGLLPAEIYQLVEKSLRTLHWVMGRHRSQGDQPEPATAADLRCENRKDQATLSSAASQFPDHGNGRSTSAQAQRPRPHGRGGLHRS